MLADTMEQGIGDCTQRQCTSLTDTMDQERGGCTQGQSTSKTNEFLVKLEPPWSMMEEGHDQLSAVYSPVQSMSDHASESLPTLDTSHVCHHCSAVFLSPRSLEEHMVIFHGETPHSESPVASRIHNSVSADIDQRASGQEGLSAPGPEDCREESAPSSADFAIKLKLPLAVKEEPQDDPLAVYSPVQPRSDSTSGSLLSLNTSHVCQHCSASFVLFSSLELHMVTFHGETLGDLFLMYSIYNAHGVDPPHGHRTKEIGYPGKKKTVRKRKVKDPHTEWTGRGKKSKKRLCDGRLKAPAGQGPFVCEVCSRVFTRARDLERHKQFHTGLRAYVCDVCSKRFAKAVNLRKHKTVHANVKPYVCDVCNKAFIRSDNLKTHKLIHAGIKPFTCDVCDKALTAASSLKAHMRTHTGERPYKCPLCDAAFNVANILQRHLKTVHAADRPYVCDVCQKTFFMLRHLKRHESVHTGEKPYSCNVCGAAFTENNILERHRRMHTGDKPFSCNICGASFSQSGNLNKHKKTHTGEKPYVCTDCGKKFAQSFSLKRHQMSHTGERPHSCPHCPSAFSRSGCLKIHIQKLHQ